MNGCLGPVIEITGSRCLCLDDLKGHSESDSVVK